jgi:hypothetical protein
MGFDMLLACAIEQHKAVDLITKLSWKREKARLSLIARI